MMKGVPFYGQLKDVNTKNIAAAIRLGCETMQRVFNPQDDNRPYYGRSSPT